MKDTVAMEFYELLEKMIDAIPPGYDSIRIAAEAALPWILGFCSAATCLFGHKIHKIWNAFFFFWIGFLVPVFVLGLLFDPKGLGMNILIVFGAVCGCLCAYFSRHLLKLQLFATAFFMVFAALPSYLAFLGKAASVAVGFAAAVTAGILSTKYKYIVTIVTTSFSGAFILFGVLEANAGLTHFAASVFSVLAGAAGLTFQCFVERKELKETWENLKAKKEKISAAAHKDKPETIQTHSEEITKE